ncbi:hypothetical protein FGSG_07063 [Fusarium graminearum PH-1]|nr:hypothetical protein FGSG_07063 [Fusarium graminearum PH-1]ESU13253.1 hypothetical protein FGSG_07063 [Fusarium graminearum PH-1]|eukprot:XP_011326760.1 hypothetical protein FGSG_07063 [Fusarium graminearum PH-1]
MDWYTLLDHYAAASKGFEPGRETQIHCMVMVALCHVAHSQGLTTDEIMLAMAKCVSGGTDTLRSKRFALPKCVQIGDELEKVLGPRAYELPLRVSAYFTFGQHFTAECFSILRRESESAHRPKNSLPSELLRIPNLVYDVCDGRSGRNRKGPRTGSDEGEGEIEIEVEFQAINKIDKQPRE